MVYVAAQENPVRRLVALKTVKLGMDTKSVVARFEAERQALALMDHPNIAKVLDGGAADSGRPYFVMELVRGIKITDYCDEAKLSIRRRLDLFIRVCQAVQHAHQKGVIHRDIKSFRRLPFSSGRGTVISSFSNGISHVYTRGALSSSGENRGTCRKKIISLSLELRASRVRSRRVESYDTRVPPYLYRRTKSHLSP